MTPKRLVTCALMCTLFGGSMLFESTQPAKASFPGENGKIAFMSARDGNFNIYVMNPDGSDQRPLTEDTGYDGDPAWSPDGTKIVFVSDRSGNLDIWVMNADGSDERALTANAAGESSPAWSPDGTKIAFVTDSGADYDIWVMNADGTGQTPLTTDPEWDRKPAWSPDGTKIAFESRRGDSTDEIYVMNADGSEPLPLTMSSTGSSAYPAWSPDGTKIAFVSDREFPPDIYVMNADGSDERPLNANTTGFALTPDWSPDGTKIVFMVDDRDGGREIYVMDADGANQTPLTVTANAFRPAWQALSDPDTDDDGIPNEQDVEETQEAILALAASAFKGGDPGHARAMRNILDEAEALIASGETAGAIKKLRSLLPRVDGCGTKADKTDWIVDCGAQVEIRELIDLLIANLSA